MKLHRWEVRVYASHDASRPSMVIPKLTRWGARREAAIVESCEGLGAIVTPGLRVRLTTGTPRAEVVRR